MGNNDASLELNAILQGMDVPAEGLVNNPVVYPELLTPPAGMPTLASVTIPFPPIQVDIPRLIGGVFQRIDALQQMLLQRIEALETRLTVLEAKVITPPKTPPISRTPSPDP